MVPRRGRLGTVCARGAHPAWSSGPSTSPLDVPGHLGGFVWSRCLGIHPWDGCRSALTAVGCLTSYNPGAPQRRLPRSTQAAAALGDAARSLGPSCAVLSRGYYRHRSTHRPRPNFRGLGVAACRLLRLCCFHGHDAPEGSEARAQCAERLTIVGGIREALLVWRRGRLGQCAPAALIWRGRPAPQLHR